MKMEDSLWREQRKKEECIIRIKLIEDINNPDREYDTEIPCREVKNFFKHLDGWMELPTDRMK
jgi:hypothetical protein